MSRFRLPRLLGALCAAAIALTLSVAAAPASAAATPQGACPSTPSKPSSPLASCATAASAAPSSKTTVGLPAGATSCASTATKPSSADAACAGSTARAAADANVTFSVKLVANPASLAPGGTTTLTATSSQDVSPTPFFIEIFDATAGSFLVSCGTGTSCSTSVTQSGSTVRNYVAYITDSGKAFPPPAPQATSSTVVVSWLGVGLTASPDALQPGGTTTLTATASLDVSSTSFFIEIFDATAGTLVAECGFGTTCSAGVAQSGSTIRSYVAYVSELGSAFPPPDVRAQSAPALVSWISIGLTASPTSLPAGTAATVTATASLDVGPTPFFIEVFDVTTGAKVAGCSTGTTCTGSVSEGSPTRDVLVAYVSGFASALPPPNIRATSDQVPVTWVPSTAVVPFLMGLPESEATDEITANNLVPDVSHQKTCTDPGDVILQNPDSGTVVPIGSTVHITVDSGTKSTCIIK